jgi:hypothetical protein
MNERKLAKAHPTGADWEAIEGKVGARLVQRQLTEEEDDNLCLSEGHKGR